MLTVIVDARADATRLPGLLAQLTAGAVDGLVRQVMIVAPREGLVEDLCEETGADTAATLSEGVQAARSDLLLIAPPDLRLRDGWIETVRRFVTDGGRAGRVAGLAVGLFNRPYGVLIERGRAVGHGDLAGLRRQLGLGLRRIG
jgi:hypothetical protein